VVRDELGLPIDTAAEPEVAIDATRCVRVQ
jgi:hypothetical protein